MALAVDTPRHIGEAGICRKELAGKNWRAKDLAPLSPLRGEGLGVRGMTHPHRRSKRNPASIRFARDQRRQANEFASVVWQLVRGRQILGEKFRREHVVGPYTLDFVCLDLKLNVEIDGKGHFSEEGKLHDEHRDAYLRSVGFEVLRIHGFRVLQDAVGVRSEIEQAIESRRRVFDCPSPPAPLPEAGRGEPKQ